MSPSTEIYFDGKKFVSLKKASEASGYAKDYIGQLCRGDKINSRRVGREWFVDQEDLIGYQDKKQKQEWASSIREKAGLLSTLPTAIVPASASVEPQEPAIFTVVEEKNYNDLNSILYLPQPSFLKRDLKLEEKKTLKNKKILLPIVQSLLTVAVSLLAIFYLSVNSSHLVKVFIYEKLNNAAQSLNLNRDSLSSIGESLNFAQVKKISANLFSSVDLTFARLSDWTKNSVTAIEDYSRAIFDDFGNFAFSAKEKTLAFLNSTKEAAKDFALDKRKSAGLEPEEKKPEETSVNTDPPVGTGPPSSFVESSPPEARSGLVVIPAKKEEKDNEAMKKKIKDSFSDEVAVIQDETGQSGIIKPKFKNSEGENYLYVLVPVKDKKESAERAGKIKN